MLWDPFPFDSFFAGPATRRSKALACATPQPRTRSFTRRAPQVEWHSTEDEVQLTAVLPGWDPADLEISLDRGRLRLAGLAPKATVEPAADDADESTEDAPAVPAEEAREPLFEQRWRLPFEVDGERIEARLERGVLTVRIPRVPAEEPLRIPVVDADGPLA